MEAIEAQLRKIGAENRSHSHSHCELVTVIGYNNRRAAQ